MPEYNGDHGVVGNLMKTGESAGPYWNHMPPSEIIEAIGRPQWDDYLSFACVRNPWDKVVSHFFWKRRDGESVNVEEFERFALQVRRRPVDLEIVAPDTAVDAVIRFENLEEDVAEIARRTGVTLPNRKLPELKRTSRPDEHRDYRALYTDATRKHVEELFADWIDAFGYSF